MKIKYKDFDLISLIIISIVLVLLYVLIWSFFVIDGPFSTGTISKDNWLLFFGSFITFAGTGILGLVTVMMNSKLLKQNEKLNHKVKFNIIIC